ncbi:hypothetical protein F5Y05DRAFT_421069 [Hypoxylon sp. FL0543]|nr:hypothetical protein F5Y05DRAFT_421069 [Hypoxylon sp. FL0543]
MDSSTSDAVSKARDRGNRLYRAGDLPQAKEIYSQGARLAPQDIRFPANLSRVEFDMGNYGEAASHLERALSLVTAQLDPTMVQELHVRLVEAYLLTHKLDEARAAISNITSEHDRHLLKQNVQSMEAVETLYRDKEILWRQMVERLPRYRPKLADDVEFSAVGRDAATSAFDTSLADSNQEDYSFLFPNVGDARDVFATLADISLRSSRKHSLTLKKFYFTLVDLKSATFARDLLMFRMLADCATESEKERRVTLATLAYTFAGHIMPSWTYDRLQTAIHHVMDELQRRLPLIMGNFCIDTATRTSISSHLLNWQELPADWYSTEGILDSTRQQHADKKKAKRERVGIAPEVTRGVITKVPPPECEPDSTDTLNFLNLSFMLPSAPLMKEYEPQLAELIVAHQFEAGVSTTTQPVLDARNNSLPNVNFTPQEVVCNLYWNGHPRNIAPDCQGAFEHLMGFFSFIGEWMVVDNVVSFMELSEHGIPSDAHPPFPNRYDRIQMSYIPDYAGGPLTVLLHGIPILRHYKTSEMSFRVALNVEQWDTRDQLLAEYLILDNRTAVTNTLAVTLTENPFYIDDVISGRRFRSNEPLLKCLLSWSRMTYGPLPWTKLVPRGDLEKWLHMHFLKICLPFRRIDTLSHSVFTPSNTIMFFRLLVHLSRVGYPLHWLSGVVGSMCTGEISTQARPPRAKIAGKAEVEHRHPRMSISIRPFIEEFKTLLVIWRRLLPFALLQDEKQLPSLDTIREYRLAFVWPEALTQDYKPVITLVLWNVGANGVMPRQTLRDVLLDDESGDPRYRDIARGPGRVHVISTLKFNSKTRIASFWFSDALIQDMLSARSNWAAYIFDTNSWVVLSEPVRVTRANLEIGDVWCRS